VEDLAINCEGFATGDDQAGILNVVQDRVGEMSNGTYYVLGIVQDDKPTLCVESVEDGLLSADSWPLADFECRSHCLGDFVWIINRRKVDEPPATGKVVCQHPCCGLGQRCLSDASNTYERNEALTRDACNELRHVFVPAEDGSALRWQISV
jgi:hypothetical protein